MATDYFFYFTTERLEIIKQNFHSTKLAQSFCLKFVSANHLVKEDEFEILFFPKSPA